MSDSDGMEIHWAVILTLELAVIVGLSFWEGYLVGKRHGKAPKAD